MGSELAGSRILVTGGSGFIGSHIVDQLVDEGVAEVVVIDNLIRGRRENLAGAEARGTVTFVDGSITDAALVRAHMAGMDYVYHQAALRITHCAAEPREAHNVMFTGTFNVLEAAQAAGVKKVVAASSASVYGEPSHLPIDEAHPYNNRTLYGAAKIANEHVLRSFNDMYGLPYVALRYFNAYGPRMDIHGVYTEVMIRWMERIEQGLPPLIFGDGEQSMDFIYVVDIARANLLALKSDASDIVLNVASGTQTTLNELSAKLCAIMGHPELEAEHQEERKVNPVRRRLGSTTLARERIGFASGITLDEGLAGLVAWWRAARRAPAGVNA
ncbi:MAG TPA: NAD-dependent epimerase/dehydratase family protein [Ktedonobacterales bacterium]|jgi:UDP-glucose 4-epimerase